MPDETARLLRQINDDIALAGDPAPLRILRRATPDDLARVHVAEVNVAGAAYQFLVLD